MLIRIIMPFLLSQLPTLLTFAKGPSRTLTFISGIKSLRSVCRGGSSSSVAEGDESSPSSAYFPIYFNDGYEVNLPKGHRFPMEKYRKVRAALQDKIMTIDEKEKKVDCGEYIVIHYTMIKSMQKLDSNAIHYSLFDIHLGKT